MYNTAQRDTNGNIGPTQHYDFSAAAAPEIRLQDASGAVPEFNRGLYPKFLNGLYRY
jgi:hypothetical protein